MLPATSITLAHIVYISTQTGILVFISHSSFISKAWVLQDLLENSCRRKEQKNIFFQTSHGMCLRPVRTINSTTCDNGTDPLVCVYTAEWYTMCVVRGWPFANGLPTKWWIISSGRTRSNAEEHQEDTAYTWQQQTSWSHVSKKIRNVSNICAFSDEKCILLSLSLASRLPVIILSMVCSLQSSSLTLWHTMQGLRWKIWFIYSLSLWCRLLNTITV